MRKNIVINGAGGGLGAELTRLHLQQGDCVYAFDLKMSDALRKLEADYPALHTGTCDVTSDDDVRAAARKVHESGRRVDILYNVAGLYLFSQKVAPTEMDMQACLSMYNVNALGPLRFCRELIPDMDRGSLILNVSSEAGSIASCKRTDDAGYSMSKAALNMGSRILSNSLWGTGIRVLNIHPGWMRTAMGGEAARKSNFSVDAAESAENILSIAQNIENIPYDHMFMDHRGELLAW